MNNENREDEPKMNELQGKMNKTSRIVANVFKFAEGVAGLGIVVSIVSLVILLVTGSTDTVYLGEGKDVMLTVAFYGKALKNGTSIETLKIFFLTAFVKELRIISVLFFVLSLFSNIKEGSLGIGFNVIGILGTVLIWSMSYIMEYGCNLQKESDETL